MEITIIAGMRNLKSCTERFSSWSEHNTATKWRHIIDQVDFAISVWNVGFLLRWTKLLSQVYTLAYSKSNIENLSVMSVYIFYGVNILLETAAPVTFNYVLLDSYIIAQ